MLSEIRQVEKDILYDLTYMCNLKMTNTIQSGSYQGTFWLGEMGTYWSKGTNFQL